MLQLKEEALTAMWPKMEAQSAQSASGPPWGGPRSRPKTGEGATALVALYHLYHPGAQMFSTDGR